MISCNSNQLIDLTGKKKYTTRHSALYGFFLPDVKIIQKDSTTAKAVDHEGFTCAACGYLVTRNLTTKDKSSGKALRVHAEKCFGPEAVKAALESNNLEGTRELVEKTGGKRQGLLTQMISGLKKASKVIYSAMPLSKAETRAECARWCAENYRPFKIVKDRCFQKLMRTGRPGTYIPSPTTVSRDTKMLFAKTHHHIAKNSDRIHIITDGWTSPNNKAFIRFNA
ncbi:hypothetical protein BDZ89DRAFT_941428 [Hymenopellis radicata]|nr:hypothetical protein BDZ89DRAFT_941428 [Hymenopellis radicata]